MGKIDLNSWKRKEIFEFFSNVSNPFYSVTFKVDVTELYEYCKKNGLSFYYSMVYMVSKALNKVENFRYSIRDNEVYLLDKRNPSFTVLNPETELFKIVSVEFTEDIQAFNDSAKEAVEKQTCFIDMSKETDELFFISCLPWLELTGFCDEMDILNPTFKDDGIARISWGKYVEENGRKKLGFALSVNHRFIDGVHVGKFVEELEKAIRAL